MNSPTSHTDHKFDLRRIVFVAVGIDDYKHFPKLTNPINDVLGIQSVFEEKFGTFSVTEPLFNADATKLNIMRLVQDELRGQLLPDDALIFFFAGHGLTRVDEVPGKKVETGYIVPVEGRKGIYSDYIQVKPLLQDIAILPPKHILVIVDACRSGFALGDAIKVLRSPAIKYTKDLLSRRSRKIITSAGDNQDARDNGSIPNSSLFAGELIQGLRSGDVDNDGNGYVTVSELGLYLQQRVAQASQSEQTPRCGAFDLHDHGELVLQFVDAQTRRDVLPGSGRVEQMRLTPQSQLDTAVKPTQSEQPGKQKQAGADRSRLATWIRAAFGDRRVIQRLIVSFVMTLIIGLAIYQLIRLPVNPGPAGPTDLLLAIYPFEQSGNTGVTWSGDAVAAALSEKLALVPNLTTVGPQDLMEAKTVMVKAQVIPSRDNNKSFLDSIQATHYLRGRVGSKLYVDLFSRNQSDPIWQDSFMLEGNADNAYLSVLLEITQKLSLTLNPDTEDRLSKDRDPRVTKLFVDALGYWHTRGDIDAFYRTISLLEEAIVIDSLDEEVNGLLALCYEVGVARSYFRMAEVEDKLHKYADRALVPNPIQPFALLAKGGYYSYKMNFNKARESYEDAHRIAPDKAITAQALAEHFLYTGHYNKALTHIEQANKAKPMDQTILQYFSWCLMANGHVGAAKEKRKQLLYYHPELAAKNYDPWAVHLIHDRYAAALNAIPDSMGAVFRTLLKGLVLIDQKNTNDYQELIASLAAGQLVDSQYVEYMIENLDFLWSLHLGDEEDKDRARAYFSNLLSSGRRLDLNWLIQTYPFDCFHSFRSDPEIQRTGRKYGIVYSAHPYIRYGPR